MKDHLTNLLSRARFLKFLDEQIHHSVEFGAPLGLLVVDIRRFRNINRNFGHETGDLVLQGVAGILNQVGRPGDSIGRIGDDQFAVLLDRVANLGHAQLAAMKIQRLLDLPIATPEREIRCAVTIGISLCPANAETSGRLLQSAEQALAEAKQLEQPIGFAAPHEEEGISADWDIEISLGESIARSELRAYYQPKIALATGRPVGAEALVRWQSASRGLLSPGVFLPVAEAIGFLKPLTIWMLNSALRQSAEWTDRWGKLSVSVNMPPHILAQPDFVDLVMSAEKLWMREHVDLCLEVLEQSLVADVDVAFEKLNTLREQGIKIAIDDFGTGYSSLSYFRDIPTDELKIDQSFIKGLRQDRANIHIVSLIMDIAHRFGLQVVAEGVDDQKVAAYLKKQGCDQAQGYYFGRPMPADEFANWLKTYQPDPQLFPAASANN
ncbi:putative bifunctional diguanylate cyclase/phosphodiesterase [Sedimenticola sp.]|uniref:putative bifunctional diguanylate cyclase/phosphodiesterase n=1 Tax=Sedimenticola sp. TaxID=1940285 RepID=UPI002590FE7F|nr:bifunctional diguanylate cyclase/phosphodiesterase [Sedimenticola sp.]MCW8902226.1 bifunctional diguanylate cyclase/phosphodiesterase [Sedimenticola sp.]